LENRASFSAFGLLGYHSCGHFFIAKLKAKIATNLPFPSIY